MAEFDQRRNFVEHGGAQVTNVGPDLASATTLVPTHRIHRVTGTAVVVTITPPWPGFSGTIELIPTAAFTWTATAVANAPLVAGTAVIGRTVFMTFNPATERWASHAIA
jgi:hypothetical protein